MSFLACSSSGPQCTGNLGMDLEDRFKALEEMLLTEMQLAVQPLRDRVAVLEEKIGKAKQQGGLTELELDDTSVVSMQVMPASPKDFTDLRQTSLKSQREDGRPSLLKIRSVDSKDVDALNEEEMQVAFGRDIWTYFAIVSLGKIGRWDSLFTMLLALVNVAMQVAFVIILMSEYFLERPFEEKIGFARVWRTSVGHDARHMDLAQTSLVSRVCRGDGSLIVSTIQAELVEQINKFLGLGDDDFEPSAFSPGTMLSVLCILLWSLRVYKDLRRLGLVLEAWSYLPRADDTVLDEENGFKVISENRYYGFGTVSLFRFGMDVMLLVAGVRLLASTTSISSLILDAVALEAILDIDDFLFYALAPMSSRLAIQSIQPMKVKISPSRSQVESSFNFCLLACALLLPYLFMLKPLGESMSTVKFELCGGMQEFVVSYNQDIQMTYALQTVPERGVELFPSEVAVNDFKHSSDALPRYMVFSPTSQAFDADRVRPMSEEAEVFPICFETQVLQETGRVFRDPVAMSLIEPRFQSAVALWGRNATSCEEMRDLCDHPDARMLRYVCGGTCGCASPDASSWYKVPRQGCSSSCLLEAEASMACSDVAPTAPGWQSFWTNYVPVISSFFGRNLAQANMLMMLNQTIQAMLREGCPRLLVDDTDFVTSVKWCDGLPDLFRPLASLCPETCGCKASFSASCPPRCQLELHNSSNASSP